MLTEEEKQKIKDEEILRDEIRQSLKKKSNGFWDFLNSQFGNWILTTVVVGGLSFLINYIVQTNKEDFVKENKIKAFDMEIESRISQFWVHLENVTNTKHTSYPLQQNIRYDTVYVFWNSFKNAPCSACNTSLTTSIIDDYDKRNIVSLMYELSSLVDKNEAKNIFRSITFITGNGIFYQSKNPTIKAIWESFRSNIIQSRWDKELPYTDCLFC